MPFEQTDLPALATEIALPAYAGLGEIETATALNLRNITADVDADCAAIARYLIERGIDGRMRARVVRLSADLHRAVNAVSPDAPAIAAIEVRLARLENAYAMFTRASDIATSSTPLRNAVFAEIDFLRDEGVVMAGTGVDNERVRLRQFTTGLISRAEQLFGSGSRITSGDVSRAKKV